MPPLLQIARLLVAALFLVGAVFNSVYTFRHGDDFYGSFARNAWLPATGGLIRRVVLPYSKVFTLMLVAFQVLVAALIFAGGDLAKIGLTLGALFSLLAALVSSKGGAVGNLVLGCLMALLARAS
jgi:hypothetical protein